MMNIKQRNVLVSAFACSPSLGSEYGVGWHWVSELNNLGNKVTVITRKRFKHDIEKYLEKKDHKNIKFYYIDWFPQVSYEGSPGLHLYVYIYIWQVLALFEAKRIIKNEYFDLIHHVTFAGIRLPSFLGGLGIPFIFGPVGGGEETPRKLLASFPLLPRIKEKLRSLSNSFIKIDPLMHYTYNNSSVIGLTTRECLSTIPRKYHHKVVLGSTIGVELKGIESFKSNDMDNPEFVILYVGRFIHWKGMHIGIKAFSIICKKNVNARLVMVGNGPAINHWKNLSKDLGIDQKITWVNWVDKNKLNELYKKASILLFPSLHDSGGMVVLEAAAHGLPTVCLDTGGPGEMVNLRMGVKIPVKELDEDTVVKNLSLALERLESDEMKLAELSDSAKEWAKEQTWNARVSQFYERCSSFLDSD